MIGDGARVLIERALAALGAPADPPAVDRLFDRFRDRYAEVPCRLSEPYPFAAELLAQQRAAGYRLGLCTNKPQGATDGLLRALGFDGLFDAVIGGDVLPGIRKPHPGHLAAVLERLGVPPQAAVMIGDSGNDLRTARALEIPSSWSASAIPTSRPASWVPISSSTGSTRCRRRWRRCGRAQLTSRNGSGIGERVADGGRIADGSPGG